MSSLHTPSQQVFSLDSAADVDQWDNLVSGSPLPDVYYRPAYTRACELAGHGKAVGVVLETRRRRFLLPLMLRPLPEFGASQGIEGYDAVSPYGYGGILPLDGNGENCDLNDAVDLTRELKKWCLSANVLCCFLRLHPLTDQGKWLQAAQDESGVTLRNQSSTIAIDLTEWNELADRIFGMRSGRRSDLNRARKLLTVEWRRTGIKEFQHIYEKTMQRLDATDLYYFLPEYYEQIAASVSGFDIAFARYGDEIVGTAMFMAGDKFAHYHLSGTTATGRAYKAATLLLNAGASWARERSCKWLHLGGGVRDGDDLFAFKKSFGGPTFTYSTLSLIADQPRYDELTKLHLSLQAQPVPNPEFFPQYRA